jgi:predicted metalloprotease with PDZ domain
MNDGDWGVLTYTFDDIVADARRRLSLRLGGLPATRACRRPAQPAPLAGIEKAGYRLVWKDEPNPYEKGRSTDSGTLNLQYSLGVSLDKDGKVTATLWGSPAFDAGIVNTAQIVAVNGEAYTPTDQGRDHRREGRQRADRAAGQARRALPDGAGRLPRRVALAVARACRQRRAGLDRLLAPRTR